MADIFEKIDKDVPRARNSKKQMCPTNTKISWEDEYFRRISDSQPRIFNIPSFLYIFLCLSGLVEESDSNSFYRATTVVFKIVVIFTSLNVWISSVIQYDAHSLKLIFGTLCSYLLVLGVYFPIQSKRKQLSRTICKISKITSFTHSKKINVFTFILFSMPVIFSILITLTSPRKWLAKFEAFGYEVQDSVAQILLISIKSYIHALIHPIISNVVTLLFCLLFYCCSSAICDITNEILLISPEAFEPTKQIDILRRKARIDDVLDSIQHLFSSPSFFIIVTNFLSCGNVIGWYLYYDLGDYRAYMFIESLIYGVNGFGCLICILWMAGSVSVYMQNLKEAFHRKAHLRAILLHRMQEPQLKRELFEKPDFTFTACDIISMKKSTILAVIGTLLTYTVLIINVKNQS
ncbi:uncharacterized protein NPIL_408901 [Nephila pilipes]|uniref:Gustatory receptor n=1 Tax=Nephila pilipes TaxID=299642 RepID=A0A8X6NL63_NEPPI|nr:uncharacterized protein NPIL_408901 [Nephila pilipes]